MSEREIISRLTRIETRLTRYLSEQGFETGARKPLLNNDAIIAPSLQTSLSSLLEVAATGNSPDGYDVYVDGKFICAIIPEEQA